MNWSLEQQSIFDFFQSGQGHLVVEAFAGTGKTTTIKEAFNYAPEARMLYAVFNKRNQKEAESKIADRRVEVKTLHSLGYALVKRIWPNAKPDEDVEADRARSITNFDNDREGLAAVLKLVSFAKNTILAPTLEQLQDLAQTLDLDSEREIDIVGVALEVIAKSKERDAQGRISFDDMVWLPVAMNWLREWYNLVVVDEAQDMNLPQLLMAKGCVKKGGRVVVVGDSRQAIYGFRGAVQNGMGMMRITLNAATLKLSTTYRCPRLVVERAREIVPEYNAAPEAPEGKVGNVNEAALMAALKIGDSILSRLNAPLMPIALACLRLGKPARIEGRDIGAQLVGMVRKLKAKSIPDLIARIHVWEQKQIERATGKNADKKREQANDIAQTLLALAEGAASVSDVEVKINSLFQDTKEGSAPAIVLSSVHKAKGLEWERVFLLSSTFRQSKGGEEANIYYVALTRSKSELYFVGGSNTPTKESNGSITEPQQPVEAPKALIPSPAPTPRAIVGAKSKKTLVPKIEELTKVEPMAPTLAELITLEVGHVVEVNGDEHVVMVVDEERSSAVIRSSMRPDGRTTLLGCKTSPSRILRKMDDTWMQKFLDGKARLNRKTQTTGEESTNEMKKVTTKKTGAPKTPKANGSIKGVTEYVRSEYAKGMNKDKAAVEALYTKVVKKWPAMERDRKGFDSRLQTCEKIAIRAEQNTKAGVKAPAKKAASKAALKTKGKTKSKAKAPSAPPVTAPANPPSAPPAPPEA